MENLPMLPADEARNREHLDRLKLAVELARDLASSMTDTDARHVPLVETILGGKPGEFDKVKAQLVEQLGAWAKVAADARVVVAVKAHFGNATQRPEQLLSLLDAVNSPWLKAAYDYSHFQLQDLDLAETMDALLPRSAFIHVKDTHRADGKWRFLLPGEGSIDYVAFGRQVKQSPYRGDIVVEVSGQVFSQPGYDPLAAARQCYEHLAPALAESGVRDAR
jgi:sugar phosphate isomerase/epimerase